jgi:hypothetical protein
MNLAFLEKSITFYYELASFEFKITAATAQNMSMDWAGFESCT